MCHSLQANLQRHLNTSNMCALDRDPLAHPMFAERQPRNALLVRITKPEGDSGGGGGEGGGAAAVKAEVVAHVTAGYRSVHIPPVAAGAESQ